MIEITTLRQARSRVAKRTLGVLGGMGPAATVDFIAKLVAATDAKCDDEHVPLVVINDPRIPDRTEAFLSGREEAVLAALQDRVRRLEDAGVAAFVMPCNSAHHWAENLQQRSSVRLLHIADAAIDALQRQVPRARRVAIMGTPVTLRSGFYQRRLEACGLDVAPFDVALSDDLIMPGIRAVKAGLMQEGRVSLRRAALALMDRGADALLLACTEIPLVLGSELNSAFVDTTAALAAACVAWAQDQA